MLYKHRLDLTNLLKLVNRKTPIKLIRFNSSSNTLLICSLKPFRQLKKVRFYRFKLTEFILAPDFIIQNLNSKF